VVIKNHRTQREDPDILVQESCAWECCWSVNVTRSKGLGNRDTLANLDSQLSKKCRKTWIFGLKREAWLGRLDSQLRISPFSKLLKTLRYLDHLMFLYDSPVLHSGTTVRRLFFAVFPIPVPLLGTAPLLPQMARVYFRYGKGEHRQVAPGAAPEPHDVS